MTGDDESEKGRFKRFQEFVYNGETGELFRKRPIDWLKLLVFYIIFYAATFGFFVAAIAIFLRTIPIDQPKLKGTDSFIGMQPGISFRPSSSMSKSTLMWLNASIIDTLNGKDDSYTDVYGAKESLTSFLKAYKNENGSWTSSMKAPETSSCGKESISEKDHPCPFHTPVIPTCTEANHFGMTSDNPTPCILLRLNRIIGWKPDTINDTTKDAKNILDGLKKESPSLPSDGVYFVCQGNTPIDQIHLGPTVIEPKMLDKKFYPYLGKGKNYTSPFVTLRLLNPSYNVAITVKCDAWSGNLKPDSNPRTGMGTTIFQVLVTPRQRKA